MVASILYVPCLGFAKISILLLYHRLSKLVWFKICVYIVIGIVGSYSLGIIVALIFPCNPIAMNWDLSITEGKCIDKAGIYLATAAVNVITDVSQTQHPCEEPQLILRSSSSSFCPSQWSFHCK
jgi:hypothetical protein